MRSHLPFLLLSAIFATFSPISAQTCFPRVVALNGVAVTIRPVDTDGDHITDDRAAELRVSDLLLSAQNICGTGPMQFGLQKSLGSTGAFVSDTLLRFSCDEIDVQSVELWARDELGNASFAETYIIVEDNWNACIGPVAQLPTDNCANDPVYPHLVGIHGISVSIWPTTQVELDAGAFLRNDKDNCPGLLRLRLVKSSDATGLPPATTKVKFTCAELGPQAVQLWAKDKKGNWTFVETYVIIQDNIGNCSPESAPPPPTCTPDLTAPTLFLYNGLCFNFNTGNNSFTASDFIYRKSDNCSSVAALRIEKSLGSNGQVPLSNSISFDCSELGPQSVLIWARDEAGNWSYTETYVISQDNKGICGPPQGISGKERRLWPEELDDVIRRRSNRKQ